ncbi:MAG: hypothetical protein AAF842_09280 [Planctomycetota bacterium]
MSTGMRIGPCDNLYTHLLDRWCAGAGVIACEVPVEVGVAVAGDVVVVNNEATQLRVVDGPCGGSDCDGTRPTPDAPADDAWPTLDFTTADAAEHGEPAGMPAIWGDGEAAGAGVGGLIDVVA